MIPNVVHMYTINTTTAAEKEVPFDKGIRISSRDVSCQCGELPFVYACKTLEATKSSLVCDTRRWLAERFMCESRAFFVMPQNNRV